MITRARLSYFGVPQLKVRRFAGTIKGESVDRALAILALQPSPTCQTLHKLLSSAIANAENNLQLAPENLVVGNVMVDEGPKAKRIRPRARGRAYRVFKRSCHVTIELDLRRGVGLEEARKEQAAAGRRARTRKQPAAKATSRAAGAKAPAAEDQQQKRTARHRREEKAEPRRARTSPRAVKSGTPVDKARAPHGKKEK